MYGIVIHREPNEGLTMAVERDWFARTYPKLYASERNTEIESQSSAFEQQISRLKEWQQLRAVDIDLVEFISKEIARVENMQQEYVSSEDGSKKSILKPFSIIKFQTNKIKDVFIQPPEHRQVAGCAWKHNVDRVTTRTAASLQRELKRLKVEVENEVVDLSSWLPSTRIPAGQRMERANRIV